MSFELSRLFDSEPRIKALPSCAFPSPAPKCALNKACPSSRLVQSLLPGNILPSHGQPFSLPFSHQEVIKTFLEQKGLTNSAPEFQNNKTKRSLYVIKCHCLSSLSFLRPNSKPSYLSLLCAGLGGYTDKSSITPELENSFTKI